MNAKELLEKIEFYKKSIEEDKAYLDELEQDDEDDVYGYAKIYGHAYALRKCKNI